MSGSCAGDGEGEEKQKKVHGPPDSSQPSLTAFNVVQKVLNLPGEDGGVSHALLLSRSEEGKPPELAEIIAKQENSAGQDYEFFTIA